MNSSPNTHIPSWIQIVDEFALFSFSIIFCTFCTVLNKSETSSEVNSVNFSTSLKLEIKTWPGNTKTKNN